MAPTTKHAGQRAVIAVIGHRNAGKSTLVNSIIGQDVSIVSDTPGTTTDAVGKAYELLPAGPVTIYDTAGLDDEGELGEKRIKAAEKIINRADLILYVVGKDGLDGIVEEEIRKLQLENRCFIPVFNFADTYEPDKYTRAVTQLYGGMRVSAKTGAGVEELRKKMAELIAPLNQEPVIAADLVNEKDIVILVSPQDNAAPKGRLIMPQIQVLKEMLDKNCIPLIVKPEELAQAISSLKKQPALVITDSQAVKTVAEIVPEKIPLTTFSMLFARAKWNMYQMFEGVKAIKGLKDNSKVLIAEGCSHHVTCDDIGRVKIPALLQKFTGKSLAITFVSGSDFPENIDDYELIIHCGGCMLNRAEIKRRLAECTSKHIPIANYGMVISLAQGVLERVSSPLL